MNKLDDFKRRIILKMLVEGQSIRSITRIAEVSKNTVARMIVNAGSACAEYQDRMLVDYPVPQLNVMRFGRFAMPRKRMWQRQSRHRQGQAMYGPGLQSAHISNSCLPGWWQTGQPIVRYCS